MVLKRVLGIGCAIASVGLAHAQPTITFNGHYGPDDVINIQYHQGSTNLSDTGVVAGFLQFNDNSHQNGLASPFETLCGDIFHDISSGSTYIDTIYQTGTFGATNTYVSAYTNATAVQAAGNIVGKDFNTVYNTPNGDTAAELQIAVWATLYDTLYTSQTETTFASMLESTGPFTVSGLGSTSHNDAILAGAYGYWKDQGNPVSNALFLLHGATGFQGQDQFTTSDHYHPGLAPEPFTMGIGLAGVGLAVRRRLRSRSATK